MADLETQNVFKKTLNSREESEREGKREKKKVSFLLLLQNGHNNGKNDSTDFMSQSKNGRIGSKKKQNYYNRHLYMLCIFQLEIAD